MTIIRNLVLGKTPV